MELPEGCVATIREWSLVNFSINRCFLLRLPDLEEVVEEVKGLGFDPSKMPFIIALRAKRVVSKSLWDAKLDAFNTWGWSEDAVLEAFRKDPNIMLFSIEKVNAVMSFWVNHLGWDPSVLLAVPKLFGLSLEKRLMPRAPVVQYLLSRGLMKKDASLITPFMATEKLFLQKFVECFEEEETSKLLSLYQASGTWLTYEYRFLCKPAYYVSSFHSKYLFYSCLLLFIWIFGSLNMLKK